MSTTLQISMIVAEFLYLGFVLFFLKKKMLSLKYTLLWLLAGVVMLLLTIFPILIVRLVKLLGVESAINGIFSLLFFFMLTIILSLTAIVSRQSERIRTLTQSQAMLEERLRALEGAAAMGASAYRVAMGGSVATEARAVSEGMTAPKAGGTE